MIDPIDAAGDSRESQTARQTTTPDAAAAAASFFSELKQIGEEDWGVISSDPMLRASYAEATGLLEGMMQRRLTTGQGRLSETLRDIVRRWPDGKPNRFLFDLLADCASCGLSIEGQRLDRYRQTVAQQER